MGGGKHVPFVRRVMRFVESDFFAMPKSWDVLSKCVLCTARSRAPPARLARRSPSARTRSLAFFAC